MKIFGIPIRIHPTFFWLMLIVGLTSLMAGGAESLALIALWVGLVFTFVVLHEVSHSLVARAFGIRVIDITLLPIGGMARLERAPEWPPAEFLIALAGPVFNFVVVALAGLAWLVAHALGLAAIAWLLRAVVAVNAVLGLFNLLPGFPMDGGRLYRSWLASRHGYLAATRRAARMGRLIALGMVAFAAVRLVLWLSGAAAGWNPLLLAIAAFIYFSGKQEEMAALARHGARPGVEVPPLWQLLGAAEAAMSGRNAGRRPWSEAATGPSSDRANDDDVIDVQGSVREPTPSQSEPQPDAAADAFRQLSEQAQAYLDR
jgi:stage IV sporulation protein FB